MRKMKIFVSTLVEDWRQHLEWAIPENIHTPPMEDTELGT